MPRVTDGRRVTARAFVSTSGDPLDRRASAGHLAVPDLDVVVEDDPIGVVDDLAL